MAYMQRAPEFQAQSFALHNMMMAQQPMPSYGQSSFHQTHSRGASFYGHDNHGYPGYQEPNRWSQRRPVSSAYDSGHQFSGQQDYNDHSRRQNVDPTPDGFDGLRRAMSASPPPSASGTTDSAYGGEHAGTSTKGSSSGFAKAISFCRGMRPFKSTLHRPFSKCRESVLERLNELGISWTEPRGTGFIVCEHGGSSATRQKSADYVRFTVWWTINGASGPALPGADMWFTKITISKDSGDGHAFRRLGKHVLDAARYEMKGGILLDAQVTTWGLT